MSGYRVVVTREDKAWLADVPELPGTHTWARNLQRLDHDVREVIALALDLPDGAETGLELDYEYHTGDEWLDSRSAELRELRATVEHQAQTLEQATAKLAMFMSRDVHLSVRDAAVLLDVSPQRISQLAPLNKRESVNA